MLIHFFRWKASELKLSKQDLGPSPPHLGISMIRNNSVSKELPGGYHQL